MHSYPRTGYMLSFVAALSWAATAPGVSYMLQTYNVPPLTLAFWRDAIIALVCGALVLALRPGWFRVGWRDVRNFALIGAISVGFYHALWVWSIALNGAALAIVLIYTYPAFVTLGSWLFFKEPINGKQMAALALALIGCILVVRAYDLTLLQSSWPGVIIGLGSALAHAGYVLFNQRAVTRHSPWLSLTLTMFFGALALLVLTTLVAGPADLLAVNNGSAGPAWLPWLALIALALGPTLGGYGLFTMALRYIPGQIASLIVVIEVPAATLLAVALLGERLEVWQIVGMALVLVAAVLPALQQFAIFDIRSTIEPKPHLERQ